MDEPVVSLFLAIWVPLGLAVVDSRVDAGTGLLPETGFAGEVARQVRVEQQVMIRVSPGAQSRRPAPAGKETPASRSGSAGPCVPLAAVAGMELGDERSLLLFLRDRRTLRAELDRTCSSREFYGGFYVPRAPDGLICAGRETLRSRSGTRCPLVDLELFDPPPQR